MPTTRFSRTRRLGMGGLVALAALLAAAHYGAALVEAQGDAATSKVIREDFALVKSTNGEIISTDTTVKLDKVVPLGADNLFLTVYDGSPDIILVFRVDTSSKSSKTVRLGEIKLNSPLEEILILDDHRSFLIRTKDGVAVWAVAKNVVVQQLQSQTPKN